LAKVNFTDGAAQHLLVFLNDFLAAGVDAWHLELFTLPLFVLKEHLL